MPSSLAFSSPTIYIVGIRLAEHSIVMECMLCFEDSSNGTACEHCSKEWCLDCDYRWRLTQHSASLPPTCPFCRKELRRLLPEPRPVSHYIDSPDFVDRLVTRMIQLLPCSARARAPSSAFGGEFSYTVRRAFSGLLCLVLFVFAFLCCHYMNRHCPLSDDDDETAVLSRV